MRLHGEKGMTLIELVVGLGVSAVLVSMLASIITMLVWLPGQQGDKMAVAADVRTAEQWLALDATSALTFTPGTSPTYGTFAWTDYTSVGSIDYAVDYSHDSANGYLMRTEKQDGVTTATLAAAKNIASAEDVVFNWYPTTYALQVALTSTVNTAMIQQGITATLRTASPNLALRSRPLATAVAAPANAPIPTPPAGSNTLTVQQAPTLIVGSTVSGGRAELQDIDSSYFVAASSTGYPAQVIYQVQSQNINSPNPIGVIQVLFTGLASQSNVAIGISVQNSAAGFPASSDYSFTISNAGQAQTVYFYLDSTALAYVNAPGPHRVTLRVAATAANTFDLSTDQIQFVASP